MATKTYVKQHWVVVLSDWRFAKMYGHALGNTGNYIDEETEDEGLVIFDDKEAANECARESVRMPRGAATGSPRMNLGAMHTVMRAGEWRIYAKERKVRKLRTASQ